MAKLKYANLLFTEDRMQAPPAESLKFIEDQRRAGNYVEQTPLFGLDDGVIKGAFYSGCAMLWDVHSTRPVTIELAHRHDWAEVLVFVGTIPDKPRELGGEIEFWIEDEQYILTRSTMIYIPGGVTHCPVVVRCIDSPIGFYTAGSISSYARQPVVNN